MPRNASSLAAEQALALLEIHDNDGVEAFDFAARQLFFNVAALIAIVSGPARLDELAMIARQVASQS